MDRPTFKLLTVFTAGLLLVAGRATGAQSAPRAFALKAISSPEGGVAGPGAININGRVTGGYQPAADPLLVLAYTTSDGGRSLRPSKIPFWYFSVGVAINDTGDIAGFSYLPDDIRHGEAFITAANGKAPVFLTAVLRVGASAMAINNARQVAGSRHIGEDRQACLTGPDAAGVIDLGTLGGPESFAWGVNDSGLTIGFADVDNAGTYHAVTASTANKGLRDLGVVGPSLLPSAVNGAYAINAAGQVVGNATVDDHRRHAFLIGADGAGTADLGTRGGLNSIK